MRRSFVVFFICTVLGGISLQAGILAQLRTGLGNIDVELFEKEKPITVSNFVQYVQSGRYRNAFVQRCDLISFYSGISVIQAGGYVLTNSSNGNFNIAAVPHFPEIVNEYGVGKVYSNSFGTIAMAKRGGETNSASSEWYINLVDNFDLDAHDSDNYFTVFGRVVRGTNVLNIFNTFQYWDGNPAATNVIVDAGGAFWSLPLRTPHFTTNDIILLDISLLNVQVVKSNGLPQISWNSVPGKTNKVEYITTLPATWAVLVKTNGTGSRMSVQDTNSPAGRRFYRVTVDY